MARRMSPEGEGRRPRRAGDTERGPATPGRCRAGEALGAAPTLCPQRSPVPGAAAKRVPGCARPNSKKLLTSLASPLRLCGPARRQRVPAAPVAPGPAGRVSFGWEVQMEPRRRGGTAGPRRSPGCGHAGTPGPCPGPGGRRAQSLRSAVERHSKYPSKTSSSLSVS